MFLLHQVHFIVSDNLPGEHYANSSDWANNEKDLSRLSDHCSTHYITQKNKVIIIHCTKSQRNGLDCRFDQVCLIFDWYWNMKLKKISKENTY